MTDIEEMIAERDKLDDRIFAYQQSILPDVTALQDARNKINDSLSLELAKQAADKLSDNDYGCGTANIETARHKIKVTVSKKVKWDEKQLFNIKQKIINAGKNPSEYIKEKLSVTEAAYKGFNPDIQKVFEIAREVTPSAPKIEIVRK